MRCYQENVYKRLKSLFTCSSHILDIFITGTHLKYYTNVSLKCAMTWNSNALKWTLRAHITHNILMTSIHTNEETTIFLMYFFFFFNLFFKSSSALCALVFLSLRAQRHNVLMKQQRNQLCAHAHIHLYTRVFIHMCIYLPIHNINSFHISIKIFELKFI